MTDIATRLRALSKVDAPTTRVMLQAASRLDKQDMAIRQWKRMALDAADAIEGCFCAEHSGHEGHSDGICVYCEIEQATASDKQNLGGARARAENEESAMHKDVPVVELFNWSERIREKMQQRVDESWPHTQLDVCAERAIRLLLEHCREKDGSA